MTETILGIPRADFDPELLAGTEEFRAAAAVAVQARDSAVRPVHLLVALARMEGGLCAALFTRARIPVEVFVRALDPGGGEPGGLLAAEFSPHTASEESRRLFHTLLSHTPPLDERRLLLAILDALDTRSRELLVRYGRVDLEQWRKEAETPPPQPRDPFAADGRPDPQAFSPGAREILALVRSEAAGLGLRGYSGALLLHAMVTRPGGLVEQACHFFRDDLDALRTQSLTLVRGAAETSAEPGGYDEGLRTLLRKAAQYAADRRASAITEQDLFAALTASPHGLGAAFFRDTGVDAPRIRRFAEDYYRDHPEQEVSGAAPSLEEAMAWFRGRLIGQDGVIETLAPHIEKVKRCFSRGFTREGRPGAAFLFCGPSGAGKTVTARLLAKVVYGTEEDVLTFEMGQFNTVESINGFVGAPPGYVGFGRGKLTNGLRDNPRRVFLFDEVEKADARVLDALLRLLDEGRIGDPAGPVRDAHETVIVVTSNLGAAHFQPRARPRRGDEHDEVDRFLGSVFGGGAEQDTGAGQVISPELREALQGFFRPEFLNRLDEVLLFAPLGPTEMTAIAEVELRLLAARLTEKLSVHLRWDEGAARRLGAVAWKRRPEQAARGVRRCVEDLVPVMLRLLDEAEESGHELHRLRVVPHDQGVAVRGDD